MLTARKKSRKHTSARARIKKVNVGKNHNALKDVEEDEEEDEEIQNAK